MPDSIVIAGLELNAHIGVPDEERAAPQRLTAHVVLFPRNPFHSLNEDLANAVDYSKAAAAIQELAFATPRRLIETLAEDVARMLLEGFAIESVSVEIRKYVLPDAGHVAVKVERSVAPTPNGSVK